MTTTTTTTSITDSDEDRALKAKHAAMWASGSYRTVVEDVVAPLGFDASRVRVPDGRAADLEFAAKEYDAAIRAAGGHQMVTMRSEIVDAQDQPVATSLSTIVIRGGE